MAGPCGYDCFSLPLCFRSPFFYVFCLLPVSLCIRFPLRARPCSRCHGFRRLVHLGCLLDGRPFEDVVFVTTDARYIDSYGLVDCFTVTVSLAYPLVLMRTITIMALIVHMWECPAFAILKMSLRDGLGLRRLGVERDAVPGPRPGYPFAQLLT